jgi:uncharacterized repeat protein (TIGR03803 family)
MSFTKLAPPLLLLFVGMTAMIIARPAHAQTETVLYTFTGGADGAFPQSGVILDSSNNVYGTTAGEKKASLFKISHKGAFKVLHSFTPEIDGYDWSFPALVRDAVGNLYGTSVYGGAYNRGTVYEVDKNDKFSVLYSFPSPWFSVGDGPLGPLLLDADGNLYGAAGGGGNCNGTATCGEIFKLDASGNETTLHAFSRPRYGDYPEAGLIRDAAGNLYGTTYGGGHGGDGVVYKLDPAGNETVLHTFTGPPDGKIPLAGLIEDAAGNLYGTTFEGGNRGCEIDENSSCGVVFKVDTNGNETVLYAFTGKSDGGNPSGPLVMDAVGNLYGTAAYGTLSGGGVAGGVVFKLDPSGKETVLYTFTGGTDGGGPTGVLSMDKVGNLYGATYVGGNLNDCIPEGGGPGYGCGVVFKMTP